MKILFLYLLLGFLGLSIIVSIDLLAHLSFADAMQSIHATFATTSLMESIIMISFLLLPVIKVIAASLKKRKGQTNQ
ncbi:hypothetical protein [Paenibacillus sp. sgz500958]|uniref:hypothetical protein n=1 Tax=Paenibacillus sp. sgz500958 TaxID=3242475 RepID=UPI0036D327EC